MDLREQVRVSIPTCFVCRYAGKHIILWPQYMTAAPTTDGTSYTSASWTCYVKVEERVWVRSQLMKSRKRELEICWDHHVPLYENWEAVARLEVDLENLWHNYMERVEDGRDLRYR